MRLEYLMVNSEHHPTSQTLLPSITTLPGMPDGCQMDARWVSVASPLSLIFPDTPSTPSPPHLYLLQSPLHHFSSLETVLRFLSPRVSACLPAWCYHSTCLTTFECQQLPQN
ncbi:hypothetical protein Pcinc_039576 [Petrolisthes cinctipes]|uniref:Uncharacterized protein n=1 Tax=Petrolisthes cinctipes TaxID=88211 RepID=A0AAE1BQY1_PETCI|nr:hypothetical protein Pcinc_039576 [Petrolisthes cinctipes]